MTAAMGSSMIWPGCRTVALSVARWRYRDRPTITQAQFQAVALAEPIGQKEVRHAVGGAAR
jgi:hypothetical protein